MKTRIILGLVVVGLLISTGAFADWPRLQGRVMKGTPAEIDPGSQFTDYQCSDANATGICCAFDPTPCSSTGQSIGNGDTVLMNTYWTETPDCANVDCTSYVVNWTLGIKPGPTAIILFQDEPVDFGDVTGCDPGGCTFCIGATLQVPDPLPGMQSVPFGHTENTPTDPTFSDLDINNPGFTVDPAASACTPGS